MNLVCGSTQQARATGVAASTLSGVIGAAITLGAILQGVVLLLGRSVGHLP